jgi:hypothetical protein
MSIRVTVLASLAAISMALSVGCGGGNDDEEVPPVADESDGCPAIFAQSVLPTWKVSLSDAEMAKLTDEFLHRDARVAAGLEEHPYHVAKVTYDDGKNPPVDVPDAMIRLKGNSSWTQTVQLDSNPKMQFVISFNEKNDKGRFMGQRKVELDMPRTDRTFLRQRLALFALRKAGVNAQCANSARLELNGDYYGLYAHMEHVDKEYLQRYYGHDDDNGDLWAGGRIIQNNDMTYTWDRLDAFWKAAHEQDMTTLETLVDLDDSIKEWAAEAVIGDADGYYNGRPNYNLYDHPTKGFVWLPSDLDTVFDMDFLPADSSLTFPMCVSRVEDDRRHWAMVMATPKWLDSYLQALHSARGTFDVEGMQARVQSWEAQIRHAADHDPHRPFTMADHDFSVSLMHDYMAQRADYVDKWLDCRQNGGADDDGDGFDFCNDCNDKDANVNPGAAEVCDGIDNDCDGLVDDVAGGATCQ